MTLPFFGLLRKKPDPIGPGIFKLFGNSHLHNSVFRNKQICNQAVKQLRPNGWTLAPIFWQLVVSLFMHFLAE